MIPVVLIALLLLPAPIAERHTSPTQDGQYLLDPVRAYGFIFTLLQVGDAAALGSSGKALQHSKDIFQDSYWRPVKVELLYLDENKPYEYVKRSGVRLLITHPPRLVWEVWGRSRDRTASEEVLDVIGFLDYTSGYPVGATDWIVMGR